MAVNINKSQINLREQLKKLERPTTDRLAVKDADGVLIDKLAGELSLQGIDAGAGSNTAVDVFVYDTSKDSDGGAWRKRTQHTSWYNETLGTATRGTRREFPAVAVIVISTNSVFGDTLTIYDGDDPDLPMWIIFKSRNINAWIAGWRASIATASVYIYLTSGTAVSALNGKICVSHSDSAGGANYASGRGIQILDFLSEKSQVLGSNSYSAATSLSPFVNRNSHSNNYYRTVDDLTSQVIASTKVNDVAMTVLPNAPTDSATGLPIPTIAVGTDNGVSIIKDGRTVFDAVGTTFDVVNTVSFDKNNRIICSSGTAGTDQAFFSTFDIPSSDTSNDFPGGENGYYRDGHSSTNLPWYGSTGSAGNHFINEVSIYGDDICFGTEDDGSTLNPGLKIISENVTSSANGMLCGVSTSYNTGWMHGDIKATYLSDTDATNLTGSELVTNGSFNNDVSGWQTQDSTNTYSSGKMQITRSGGSGATSYQAITTVVGTRYVATAEVNSTGSRGDLVIKDGTGWGGATLGVSSGTAGQLKTLSVTFIATSTTASVAFSVDNNGTSIIVDNISVRVGEEDRSVNNIGLAVMGTIHKNPVASGADLVAYSNFQADNRLIYSASNMGFGTGDFSVSVWCIPSTDQSNEFILELNDASDSNRFYFLVTSTTTKRLYLPWDTDVAGSELTPGTWNHIVVGRRNGYGFVYVNGKWISDGYKPYSTNLVSYGRGTIGNYSAGPTNDYAWSGSLALLRISGSVPSAAQVKKMYEDEKVLFQENAKCTLYGSSDEVTALAYDATTESLHVGTSSGRSEFKGLSRVNNTTTGVTAAISASNGLVAEQ